MTSDRPFILLRLEQLVADVNKAMAVAAEQGVRVILDVIRTPSETPPSRIELRQLPPESEGTAPASTEPGHPSTGSGDASTGSAIAPSGPSNASTRSADAPSGPGNAPSAAGGASPAPTTSDRPSFECWLADLTKLIAESPDASAVFGPDGVIGGVFPEEWRGDNESGDTPRQALDYVLDAGPYREGAPT